MAGRYDAAVRLRAEVDDYIRSMERAKKSTKEVGDASKKSSQDAAKAAQEAKRVAAESQKAYQAMGGAMLAVGSATGALLVSLAKTGIAYNTLQQTSRAALTTLLGGAKQANEQMDRLDDFARNSPFAKQVFINAQRQMIGFGIESRKVIPYLDAIQNAVAAMGGSNDDIAGIAESIAKVQSQGKITAITLMELGRRGIDAATLIGSEMGKTGSQIRTDITRGAIGAEEAMDALTTAMSKRFDGAAANVKNTFEGAIDRVKAAWRDLGAEMAEPLVGSEGGGVLIDLANDAADLMRAFQRLPEPVKATVAGLGGLVAVVGTLGGAFLVMAPRIVATRAALETLRTSSTRAATAMRATGIAAGVAGAAITAAAIGFSIWASNAAEARARTDEYLGTLEEGTGAVTAQTEALIANKIATADVAKTQFLFATSTDSLVNTAERMGITLAELIGYIHGEAEAIDAVKAKTEAYIGEQGFLSGLLETRQVETRGLIDVLDSEAAALVRAGEASVAAAEAGEVAADAAAEQAAAVEQAAAAAQEAEEAYAEWHKAVEDVASQFTGALSSYDAVIDKQRELAEESAAASASSKDSWEDYYDGTTVTAKQWIASLKEQVEAQREWAENLVKATEQVKSDLPVELQEAGQAMVDELRAKGPEGAEALATFVDMSPKQKAKIVALSKEAADLAGGALQERLDIAGNPVMGVDVNVANAQIDLDNFIRDANNRKIYVDIHGRQVGVQTPSGVIGRASGGPVTGPGTETSDSIPAMLSNGEHVLSAREVRGMGGHGAVERIRAAARSGFLALASGGRVGWAQDQVDQARKDVKAARDNLKAARAASKATGSARARREERAAQDELRDAQRALQAAKQRVSRLKEDRRDLRTDLRRGTIRDSVTGGLGGALGVVDRLYDESRNKDLSKKQRKNLAETAKESERALSRLYSQAEKVETKLAAARDRVAELSAISDKVSSTLSGEQSLASSIIRGETTTDKYGRQSTTKDRVTSKDLVRDAKAQAAKIRAFAGKLSQLQKAGLSGVVLQEVAMLGSEEGSLVADALIAGGKADINALNAAYKDIAKWSDAAGQYVTEGFYKGGLSAAEGLVKGLEDQQAAIEKQMVKIAKRMEKALKKALGIKSPSTVMRAAGHDTADGAILGVEDRITEAQNVAKRLGNAFATGTTRGAEVPYGRTVSPGQTSGVDLSNLAVEITMTTDRKFAAAIWRQGGQEVARTDRAVVRSIVGAS